jgi:hypothetical protein
VIWTWADVAAPAEVAWALLTDLARWPEWGPSVRSARLDRGPFGPGARGRVETAVGMELPFEVTGFEAGRSWSWSVAGVAATGHRVEPTGPASCRVGFGVPAVAFPYLLVCRIALARIAEIAPRDAACRPRD